MIAVLLSSREFLKKKLECNKSNHVLCLSHQRLPVLQQQFIPQLESRLKHKCEEIASCNFSSHTGIYHLHISQSSLAFLCQVAEHSFASGATANKSHLLPYIKYLILISAADTEYAWSNNGTMLDVIYMMFN